MAVLVRRGEIIICRYNDISFIPFLFAECLSNSGGSTSAHPQSPSGRKLARVGHASLFPAHQSLNNWLLQFLVGFF
jgi:hypothetical protein